LSITWHDGLRANDLRISRRKRAAPDYVKMPTISRAAVVLHPSVTAGRDSSPE
jgi:hypothetical protein